MLDWWCHFPFLLPAYPDVFPFLNSCGFQEIVGINPKPTCGSPASFSISSFLQWGLITDYSTNLDPSMCFAWEIRVTVWAKLNYQTYRGFLSLCEFCWVYCIGDWMNYCRNKSYQFQCPCKASLRDFFSSHIMNLVLRDWSEDALPYMKSTYILPFLSKVQTTKRQK